MTNQKNQQIAIEEEKQLIALRRDVVSAMNRMLDQHPLSQHDTAVLLALSQVHHFLTV